jgi:peroxiredoxin
MQMLTGGCGWRLLKGTRKHSSGWESATLGAILGESIISIDLGWVAAVQENQGWVVTDAPPAPPIAKSKQSLKAGDLLLSIDGHNLAELGALAVARMLGDVPFRAVPMQLERDGKTYDMRVFGEGVLTDRTAKPEPSYALAELVKRDAPAPDFSLLDVEGQRHTLESYRGKWILFNFWGTWCAGCIDEIPALNYLSLHYKSKLLVLSVAINDSPDTLKSFLAQHPLSYPVLLGGTFDDPFARSYNVRSAPRNLIIAPNGNVRFVGGGSMSLKRAVQIVASAQRAQ